MGHEVYAGTWEIAGKSGMNKSIARFPDVCMSPPSPPAGPLPVPYPDTSFSTDLKEGSRTVKVGGEPAALAQLSYYKPAMLGDEAATQSFGANVVTHVITGKTYFQAWSMDVKIEGKHVCRHLDITTSNHASSATTTAPVVTNEAQTVLPGQGRLFCECCGNAPHSPAQAFGEEITEEQYYTGTDITPGQPAPFAGDALAALDLIRNSECRDMLPPRPPTNDPCAKYYRTRSAYAQAGRRRFGQAGADPVSNQNSLPHIHGQGQLAHRVPLNAGGCPIGAGNLAPVQGRNCQYIENVVLRDIHRQAGPYNPAYVSPPGTPVSTWMTGGF